jgi:protein-S-isoprenylcysteine O-methyltransferase Ste14
VVTSVLWFVLTGGAGAVLVPWWLTGWRARHPFPHWGVAEAVGVVLIVAGLIAPLHVFVQFVRAGGTPMPGAVTTRLVVTGLNRYVRNPIYLGAVTIFVGEALLLGRLSLLLYAVAAWIGIAAFVRWYEEPALVRRFGADYQVYRRDVRAWLPRLHAWDPDTPVGTL